MRASWLLQPPEQESPVEGRAASLWKGKKALSINHTSATAKGWTNVEPGFALTYISGKQDELLQNPWSHE